MTMGDTSAESRTVFLVDDDSSAVNLYSRGLQQAGFKTASAFDATQACDALPNLSADLIILDLMLPRRGGLDLLRAIRADSRHKDTPVLVLSNTYLPEMSQRALKAGGSKAVPRSECTSSELVSISRELAGVRGPDDSVQQTASLAEQLKKDLLEAGSAEIAALRQHLRAYANAAGSAAGQEHILKFYQTVRLLSTRAGLAACGKIAQLSGAVEAMLYEQLARSDGAMSPSSIQTLVQAANCLGGLFNAGSTGSFDFTSRASVLLVDDDHICNMANEVALKRANYDAVAVIGGIAALDLLTENEFDLILLDIDMPEMDGIQVCQRLRRITRHQNTPVIFLTVHSDFENRAKALIGGGNDLISKPISPLELIVKATIFLLTTTKPRKESPPPEAAAPAAVAQMSSPEGHGVSEHAFQVSVTEKLKLLRQALADETEQREAVEQQAAENAKRRAELETAIEENQRSQQWFRQLLEESQQQESEQPGKPNLSGRRRALLECRNFVADKLIKLKKALQEETERREAVKQQMAENVKRRTELEDALAKIQAVQASLQQEVEAANSPAQLLELQTSLSEKQQTRDRLAGELETARRELEALRTTQAAKETQSEAQAKELQAGREKIQKLEAAHADAEQQIKKLQESLTAETERREDLRRRAAEHAKYRGEVEAALAENELAERLMQREIEASQNAKRRGELEAELAENKQAQAQLRNDLEEAQKELRAQRAQDPSARESEALQRVQRLMATLAEETRARELAEQKIGAIEKERAKLENELSESRQAQTETLSAEIKRRKGAEQLVADIGGQRSELETQLSQARQQLAQYEIRLQAQQQNSSSELTRLETRVKELQAHKERSKAQDARWEAQIQELQTAKIKFEQELGGLTKELAEETQCRKAAEQQAADIVKERGKLETELSKLTQAEAKLQSKLEKALKEHQARKKNSGARQKQLLEERIKALQAHEERSKAEEARLEVQIRELQFSKINFEQELSRLTRELAEETQARITAEQQLAQIENERGRLESELKENRRAQAQLRLELEKAQKEYQAQQQNSGAEQTRLKAELKERIKALQAQEKHFKAEESRLEAQIQDLRTAKTKSEQKVHRLTKQVAQKEEAHKAAEQQAATIAKERDKLESELNEHREAQAELRSALQKARREYWEQQENLLAEQTLLEVQVSELSAASGDLERRVNWLTKGLAEETSRRDDLAQRRNELEAQLVQSRQEVAQYEIRLQAQQQNSSSELTRLEACVKELQAQEERSKAQETRWEVQIQELQAAKAEAEQQVNRVTESLTREISLRKGAEGYADEFGRHRAELEAQLLQSRQEVEQREKRLQAQQQNSSSELARLEARVKELQAREERSKAEEARLEAQIQELQTAKTKFEQELGSLTKELAEETCSRKAAEQQAADIAKERGKLETELSESRQAQTRLRLELEDAQKERQALQEKAGSDQTRLEARTRDLESLEADLLARVKRLTETLSAEIKRREGAEQLVADIGGRRSELEAQLSQARQQLAQYEIRLQAQPQNSGSELTRLEARVKELQAQEERSKAEEARLEAQIQELQAAKAEAEQQVNRVTESLTREISLRKDAEGHADEIGRDRAELESQLARLRLDLDEAGKKLLAARENSGSEKTGFQARVDELQAAYASVQQETKRLSTALNDETTRRENAEKQATEIGRRRQELESELTKSRQELGTLEAKISENKGAQAKLQQDLEESRKQLQTQTETSTREQFHLQQRINELQMARIELEQKLEAGAREIRTLTADLTAVRTTLEHKALQQPKLAERIAEFEHFKAELTTQAEKAATQIKSQESSILSLDSQLRDRNGKIAALESTLQSETAQRRQDQSRIETLGNDLARLTALLSEKTAEQQRLRDHEPELAHRIGRLNDELAQSSAAAGIREAEIARLTSAINDLRIVESALCARVREITALHDAACKRVQELESKGLAPTREIANRDLELAGLRYTVLNAVRIAKRFSRERIQADCQAIDTWKSLIGTLLETPLSKTQRGMVTEIVCALEGWKKGRASTTPGAEFQVESLELHNSEFDCAEFISKALAEVEKNAVEGTTVRTAITGEVPTYARGSAGHIHQLLTTLASSLPQIGRAETIEIEVSFESKQGARMCFTFLLSSTLHRPEDLFFRLQAVVDESTSLRGVDCDDPEGGFASAWQLAVTLAGNPSIDIVAEKVRVKVALPFSLPMIPQLTSAEWRTVPISWPHNRRNICAQEKLSAKSSVQER